MNVGFSIPIHEEGQKYLNEVFTNYTEVKEMGKVCNPIIHMYAKRDTFEEDGSLNGYIDSLFCDCYIYDTKKMEVYKKSYSDSVYFGKDAEVSNMRVFKDGSSMVMLYGDYDVSYGTSIYLYKITK